PSLGSVSRVIGLRTPLTGPTPACPHLVPLHGATLSGLFVEITERTQCGLLTDPPLRGFHELEHGDGPSLVPRTQRHTERRGGFAFHVAGVHSHQWPMPPLLCTQPVVGYVVRSSLWHQAALPVRDRTSPPIRSAATSPSGTCSAPSCPASSAPSPRRILPVSQSMTTLLVPWAAMERATVCERCTGSGPLVARPSVTTTSNGRLRGSRNDSLRNTSLLRSRPSATGVRPPVGSSRSLLAAMSTLVV